MKWDAIRAMMGRHSFPTLAALLAFASPSADGQSAAPPAALPVDVGPLEKSQLDELSQPVPFFTERLPNGYRREVSQGRFAIDERIRAALAASGKLAQLDPATGERIVTRIVDHLPEGWGRQRDNVGGPVDSLGRPIVNAAAGLPGWTQVDVDALRDAIKTQGNLLANMSAYDGDRREIEGTLGNFIGQAITRGIAFQDLLKLDDPALISDGVARAIIGYLHFYENLKYVHVTSAGDTYSPTAYDAAILRFIAGHGADVNAVLALETGEPGGIAGGQPSGCYARTSFARGMTNLVTPTIIWDVNGFDDESADISIGMPLFIFYSCNDAGLNDMVRVSTNGFLTFFQRGGGTTDGFNFTNDPIPLADDPDGLIAPWWDDLIIAAAQGSPDRVSYKTEGATDTRVFTVEWSSISRRSGLTTDFHYFQVKLYETTDVIELHYGLDTAAWSPDTADSATCGIENYTGAGGDCGPNCLNTNSNPPPNDYRFAPVPRPENDNCANAIELINGATVTGSVVNATADGAANCGDANGNRDVWYTFVARCNGTLNVDTCGSRDISGATTGIDTVVSVHSGCPGSTANQLACNDDAGQANCNGNDSAVSVSMTAGQRVYIRVAPFGDLAFRFATGAFKLHVNFASTNPPSNNNCASAQTILNGNTLVGNLLCASNDGSADCGSSETNPDIWYQFTAPSHGLLALSLCGSRNSAGVDTGPDTVLSVHIGCPGTTSNLLACNDDGFSPGCNSLDSKLAVVLDAGENVRIRVTHFGSDALRVGNGVTVLHADFGPCVRGDANCDGLLNNFDIEPWVAGLVNGQAAWEAQYSCNYVCAMDANGDGLVNNFDIDPFVNCLVNGCP